MSDRLITTVERRQRLATRHLLRPSIRSDEPTDIAEALVVLHASDPVTPYLSVMARQANPSVASMEAALYEHKALLRHHAMRRTIWIATPPVVRAMHAASTRKLAGAERRTILNYLPEDEGWLDAALDEIAEHLEQNGPTDTKAIGEARPHLRLATSWPAGSGKTIDIPIHTKTIVLGGFEGRFVRGRPLGSWIAAQYVWALREQWTDELIEDPSVVVADGAREILERYLRSFGPATLTDLRWWTGWTKTQVVKALEALAAIEISLEASEEPGWVLPDDVDAVEASDGDEPWVALLPGLDPTAMGWKERSWYLSDDVNRRVTDRWGNIGPTVWVDGEVVGGWVQHPSGEIRFDLDAPVGAEHRALLDDATHRLVESLGDTRFRFRFPSPNQAGMLAEAGKRRR